MEKLAELVKGMLRDTFGDDLTADEILLLVIKLAPTLAQLAGDFTDGDTRLKPESRLILQEAIRSLEIKGGLK